MTLPGVPADVANDYGMLTATIMNDFVRTKLEELRADYSEVKGEPFSHFYCPILFQDEEQPLCEAHIINQAFTDSARATTVQRADVDSFYGSRFESDFLDVQRYKERSTAEIVTDRALSRRFASKILLENKPVEFFFGSKGMPAQFTPVDLGDVKLSVPFGLKMHPREVKAARGKQWEIEVSRDVRIFYAMKTPGCKLRRVGSRATNGRLRRTQFR